MTGPAAEGVFVYAKDLERIAQFYAALLGLRRLHGDADRVVLAGTSMQLIVHAMPPAIAASVRIASPPTRRYDTALKFFFTVSSIAEARERAPALGGEVLTELWEGPGFRVCNAIDPEGNVFQVRERTQ